VARRTPDRIDAQVARLRMLAEINPEGALALAIELVDRERVHRALEPALEVIARAAPVAARAPLRTRYFDLAEHGDRYDQDCALRVGIVKALAAIESREDADVAESAIATVQIRMGVDVAQNLRAEGLLLLALLEPEQADFRAVELLLDPHASTFSGEPSVTAVRVLAKRGQLLPIWAVARRSGTAPDVLAQAFASLASGAPKALQSEALLAHLAEARGRGEEGEALALVAAEAIVLNELRDGYREVLDLLRSTPNTNLREYLELTVRRSTDKGLQDLLKSR
jgi:hypothetical protein